MVEHDPHTHVVHVIVAVNDDVPCGYDRMHLWNLIGDSGIASADPVERLADYLQLSLRCCLPDSVSEVLIPRQSSDNRLGLLSRFLRVPQVCGCVMPHRVPEPS